MYHAPLAILYSLLLANTSDCKQWDEIFNAGFSAKLEIKK